MFCVMLLEAFCAFASGEARRAPIIRFLRKVALKLQKSLDAIYKGHKPDHVPVKALLEKIASGINLLSRMYIGGMLDQPPLQIIFIPGFGRVDLLCVFSTSFDRFVTALD